MTDQVTSIDEDADLLTPVDVLMRPAQDYQFGPRGELLDMIDPYRERTSEMLLENHFECLN